MASRQRVDRFLVAEGLARDVQEAHALIDDDRVTVNGAPVLNSARQVSSNDRVAVLPIERFVSRGGLKLEAALAHFERIGVPVSVRNARVLDIGASTGGFTDCVLQRGAASVVACDVGHGLLHPKIANDPRVDVRNGVNARDIGAMVTQGELEGNFDLVVADVSFISLRTIVDPIRIALRDGGELLALVKPQFEATKREADRGEGVISDETIRRRCIDEVAAALADAGLLVVGEVESAVPGPAGNREHWLRAVSKPVAATQSIV